MKTLCYLFLAFPFTLVFLSCTKEPLPNPRIFVILYDISGSTASEQIRSTYIENSRIIISRLTHGDAFYAALISDRSIAELRFPISISLPPLTHKTDNPLYKLAEEKKANELLALMKDSLLNVIQSLLLQDRRIPRTEIMGALQIAGKIFKSYSYKKKVLVLMSDMIEDSHSYNFTKENLTQDRIQVIITTEGDNGRLPDLQDVKIYVTGASAPNQAKYHQIAKFWAAYFEASKALFSSERYGAAMIRFDE
jgi:hypothetical protein